MSQDTLTVTPESVISTDKTWTDGAMPVSAAVAFAGVSRSELYRLMERGELPYSMPGKRRLISRRALVELVAANARQRQQ